MYETPDTPACGRSSGATGFGAGRSSGATVFGAGRSSGATSTMSSRALNNVVPGLTRDLVEQRRPSFQGNT